MIFRFSFCYFSSTLFSLGLVPGPAFVFFLSFYIQLQSSPVSRCYGYIVRIGYYLLFVFQIISPFMSVLLITPFNTILYKVADSISPYRNSVFDTNLPVPSCIVGAARDPFMDIYML